MLFDNVSIAGVAHVDPPHRITSRAIGKQLMPLLQKIGLDSDMIELRTGIVARRFWDEDVKPSDAATLAAEKAIVAAGIDRSKIGIIINTSVCRDYIEPSTACIVHGNLGLSENCINFDIGNACLAFMNGMSIAGQMIERGDVEFALVVDGESSRHITTSTIQRMLESDPTDHTFRDQFASLTLGSGAAAMILAHSDLAPDGHNFLGQVDLAATQWNQLCHGQNDEMETDTRTLLSAGLQLAQQTWMKAINVFGWAASELDHFIIHQVSKTHTEKLVQQLGLDLQKVHKIYQEYGNIGPASLPLALSKTAANGKIKKGERIALLGIGSGLNCSMAEVVW